MKHCILQDSSFLIATIDKNDVFHKDAVFIFNKLIKERKNIKLIVPTLVFYETIVTLIKKGGVSRQEIETKLWNFLYSDMIINVSLIETGAFKICKKLKDDQISSLRTQDFIIISVGLEYDAQILTFDKTMRKKVGSVYEKIYYCSNIDNKVDETPKFLTDLNEYLGRGTIDINDIPF